MVIKWAKSKGFTVVELIVIISVIGILASISVVGYGAWQKRTYENVVKSDLNSAVAALESARNFGSGYPTTLPSTFTPSENVTILGGGSTDSKTYCVQANSTKDTSIMWYVSNTNKNPQAGNCLSAGSSGLVAWWPMNGNANDTSGNGVNGTVNGATLTTGKNGQANGAYAFNGTSTYIGIPTISIPTAVTASAWVYSSNFSQNAFIIGKNPVNTQWEVFFEASGLKWRGGAPYDNGTSCSLPANNAWHHIVGSQSGAVTALYIDGALCKTMSVSTPIGNGTGTIEIGRYTTGYYFNGSIDDVRIYNRALTPAEVSALYSANAQ